MKRKRKPVSESLNPVILYYDDIEALFYIFQELSSNVELSTDEYDLASLADLLALEKDVMHSLVIKVKQPFTYLELSPKSIRLYTDEDTIAQRGIIEKLKQYLNKRQRKLCWLIGNANLSLFVCLLSLVAAIVALVSGNLIAISLIVPAAILCTLWARWAWIIEWRKWTVIYLKRKKDMPNFFMRKRDDVILAGISGLIGALLGALMTLLITKITR
jgi:hypothetical protein